MMSNSSLCLLPRYVLCVYVFDLWAPKFRQTEFIHFPKAHTQHYDFSDRKTLFLSHDAIILGNAADVFAFMPVQ